MLVSNQVERLLNSADREECDKVKIKKRLIVCELLLEQLESLMEQRCAFAGHQLTIIAQAIIAVLEHNLHISYGHEHLLIADNLCDFITDAENSMALLGKRLS